MIVPSLISNWLRITLVYMAIPLATLIHCKLTIGACLRLRSYFAAESRFTKERLDSRKRRFFLGTGLQRLALAKAAIKQCYA
jgi:hypothetical protein